MTAVGIRELKNNLSEYVRAVERGKAIAVTSHGRVVAELVPPRGRARKAGKQTKKRLSRWGQLVAAGAVHPAVEDGDPFEGDALEALVPRGSSQAWLDWSREDK
jgi:prevent-host-death family protein